MLTSLSSTNARAEVPVLNPFASRLPSQGIAIYTRTGLLFVSLNGSIIGQLPRFGVGSHGEGPYGPFSGRLQALANVDQSIVLLDGRHHSWTLGRNGLRVLHLAKVPLVGGYAISVGTRLLDRSYYQIAVRDHLGHLVVSGNSLHPTFAIVAEGRLLITPTVAMDLATGQRWTIDKPLRWAVSLSFQNNACLPAGIRNQSILAVCATNTGVGADAVAADGALTKIGSPIPNVLGPESAWLAPSGDFVAAQLSSYCGAGPVLVVSISGTRYSPSVDWIATLSSGGQLVAYISAKQASDCSGSGGGAYLVSPSGRKRRLIHSAQQFVAWG